MTVQLISARMIAPLVGNSIFTWTSVIGITLLGLALGSFVGGKIADAYTHKSTLPLSFVLSSISVFSIPFFLNKTSWLLESSESIIFLNVALSTYLFLVPAFCLGIIQPIILKKFSIDHARLGSEYGLLSAVWSFGSIAGVFLTGFYFISNIGNTETVFLVSGMLAITGVILATRTQERRLFYLIIGVLMLLIVACFYYYYFFNIKKQNVIFTKETDYYNVRIVDIYLHKYGKSRILMLDFDTHSIESEYIIENVYTEIYPAFAVFKKQIQDIAVLGAGAYTLPKHLQSFYKNSKVTVIEIDPAIKDIAEKYFKLDSTKIASITGDARQIIKQSNKKYDLIFGDTYNSFISVPGYMLTNEFNNEIKNKLNPGGIYAINFISSIVGENSDLFRSILTTMKKTFPSFYVFAFEDHPEATQNIIIIGVNDDIHIPESKVKQELSRSKNPSLADNLVDSKNHLSTEGGILLTDNFYPVEKLMVDTIREYFQKNLASNELIL